MNDSEGCRALAEHLHHEHGRLNRLLLETGHEVAGLASVAQPEQALAQLALRLADLRKQLQSHFAEEEAGGCLEEAVTRCPSLAEDSKAVVREHPQLDRMLEQLVAQTRDATAVLADIQRSYRAFFEKLQAHEAAQNRILQMAFGAEAADYDIEEVD